MLKNAVRKSLPWLLLTMTGLSGSADAKRLIESTSLNTCMDNSGLSASLFDVSFSPDDRQLQMNITASSSVEGKVNAIVTVSAYGFKVFEQKLDPCATDAFTALCPATVMNDLDIPFQTTLDESDVSQIPNIAYQIPDLDGKARLVVNDDTGKQVACVEAPLTNGKTVNQLPVKWVTAVITGIGLIASAITSGLGHANTAAHLAANVLTLFGYFQALAMVGMIAVPLPPLVSSWTQNFDWAVGIINIKFMQTIFTWYVRATGGTPSTLLEKVATQSVQIAKRSVTAFTPYLMTRAASYGFGEILDVRAPSVDVQKLARRADQSVSSSTALVKVTGIERMAFKADIEATNFFMTGLAFLVAFWGLVVILVASFKGISELAVKQGWMRPSNFVEFRNGWLTVFKGIMYRVVLIGFPQMAILCPWEFTHHDSPAVIVLAVFFLITMIGILGWGCWRVLSIARRSVALEKGPAYSLYADPAAVNRWGFLYVQFRSSAYYYILPQLGYTIIKAFFIAFGQKAGAVQGIALMLIELGYLVAVCVVRPWLDRRTNVINIAVASVNFLNAIFLMVFSGVTKAPDMVGGVLGVVFFIVNAVFAFVLLVLILIAVGYALFSKNPEVRYTSISTDLGGNLKGSSIIRDIDQDNDDPFPQRPSRQGSLQTSTVSPISARPSLQASTLQAPPRSRGPSPSGPRSRGPSPVPPPSRGSATNSTWSDGSRPGQQQAMNWQVGAGYDH